MCNWNSIKISDLVEYTYCSFKITFKGKYASYIPESALFYFVGIFSVGSYYTHSISLLTFWIPVISMHRSAVHHEFSTIPFPSVKPVLGETIHWSDVILYIIQYVEKYLPFFIRDCIIKRIFRDFFDVTDRVIWSWRT